MRLESVRAPAVALLALACVLSSPALRAASDGLPSPRTKFHSVETPSFRVVGAISPRRIAETAERLETFRAALGRLKPQAPARTSLPALVLAFSGERELKPYLILDGQLVEGYSGVFHQSRFTSYMVFDATAGEDPLDSVYSGYIHFFVGENYPRTPLWLQVGLAQYYETFRATASTVEVGRPHPAHARYLAQGWRIPLPQLLEVSRESPGYRDPDQYGIYVSHCWALVHYLLVGGEGLAPRVPDLLARLDRGEALDPALRAALGISAAELDSRLRLYIKQPIFHYQIWKLGELAIPEIGAPAETGRPEVLALLGEYLAHSEMPDAARTHLDAALAAEPANGDALAMLGFLAEEAGNADEAESLYTRALAGRMRRPVSALRAGNFALERARGAGEGSLSFREQAERARAAARAALELDPGSGEAHALDGRAALAAGAGAEAMVALTAAQAALPARVDVVYDRYRAALAANQPVVARGIVTGPLARLDPERASQELRFLDQRKETELESSLSSEVNRAIAEERFDDALQLLRDGLAKSRDPQFRDYLTRQLAELESWVAGKRRTAAYNHAVELINGRNYSQAAAELDALLADCPAGTEVCALAQDAREKLGKQMKKSE